MVKFAPVLASFVSAVLAVGSTGVVLADSPSRDSDAGHGGPGRGFQGSEQRWGRRAGGSHGSGARPDGVVPTDEVDDDDRRRLTRGERVADERPARESRAGGRARSDGKGLEKTTTRESGHYVCLLFLSPNQ